MRNATIYSEKYFRIIVYVIKWFSPVEMSNLPIQNYQRKL